MTGQAKVELKLFNSKTVFHPVNVEMALVKING